jgi:hypothetical protein
VVLADQGFNCVSESLYLLAKDASDFEEVQVPVYLGRF